MSNISEEQARAEYEKYLEEGLMMFPPFKGYGMKLLQFAMEKPEMYRQLFMTERNMSYLEYLDAQMQWQRVLPSIQESMELNETDARWIFENMLLYVHGMSALLINGTCVMTQEKISENLGAVCRGLLMQLRSPEDERIKVVPGIGKKLSGEFVEYIEGKKNVIIGYGSEKGIYQIHLEAILYFEAVGERVFAYTKDNIYEIKQRLYKVEEQTKSFHFVRASKSLLINRKKIDSMVSDGGGRVRVTMINGEIVMATRSYSKSLLESMKKSS